MDNKAYSKVPVKAGFWSKFKSFWLQPIVLELTPKEKKVFGEVHDFFNQEIYYEKGSLKLRKNPNDVVKANLQSNSELEDENIKISL